MVEASRGHDGLGLKQWLECYRRKKQSDEGEDCSGVNVNSHVIVSSSQVSGLPNSREGATSRPSRSARSQPRRLSCAPSPGGARFPIKDVHQGPETTSVITCSRGSCSGVDFSPRRSCRLRWLAIPPLRPASRASSHVH